MEIRLYKKQAIIERLFLFLWVLIIVPKTIAMGITMALGIYLLWKLYPRRKSTIYVLLLALGFIQLLAIGASLLYLPFNLERIAAGINTSFIWICAAGLFELFRTRYVSIVRIGKYCLINLGILALLGIIAFLQYRFHALTFLPAMHITDWVNGQATFRLLCLMDYSNCIPIFVMLCLPCSLIYLKHRFKRFWGIAYLFLFVVSFALIYYSNSRISILAFAVFVLLCGLALLRKRTEVFGVMMALLAFAVVGFVLLRFSAITEFLDNILNARAGSNNMRMSIYSNGIATAMQYNPLFGVGVKIMYKGYPLGSHSTVIGAFYKTGIIGLVLLLSIPFVAIHHRVRHGHRIIGLCLISLLIVFFLEDIDGSNWIALFFFPLLGITQKGAATPIRKFLYSQERKLL